MNTNMNTPKKPEIKFIGLIDLQSVSNKNLKQFKIKTFSYLPTKFFLQRLLEHIIF